jgi:GNAT superfamily N-acetyltransferase
VAIVIRPARADDGPVLRDIERVAGGRFRDLGLGEVADAEPHSVATLAGYAAAGRSWVAVDEADRPVGYLIVDVVDGNAHIEQVSVAPDHQGVGVGHALIDHACVWAADTGRPAVTLTTFADVPWNGPMYRHLGFDVLSHREFGPDLRRIRDEETAHGLDPQTRICMRLRVTAAG